MREEGRMRNKKKKKKKRKKKKKKKKKKKRRGGREEKREEKREEEGGMVNVGWCLVFFVRYNICGLTHGRRCRRLTAGHRLGIEGHPPCRPALHKRPFSAVEGHGGGLGVS